MTPKQLKRWRRHNGVTALEAAALLQVNIRTYWRIEQGLRPLRQCEHDKLTQYVAELNAAREKWSQMSYSNRGRES